MRTRKQTINDLIEASDFKDSEIVLNTDFIRGLFNDAVGQLKDTTKIVADNKRHRAHIKQLEAQNAQLQAERDAAVEDINTARSCRICKNLDNDPVCSLCSVGGRNFEWRGVQKEG